MGQRDSGRSQKSHGSVDQRITDDHVLMTAAEAFGAGVETTSTTLLWILAYLLHHPEVRTHPTPPPGRCDITFWVTTAK